MIENSDANGRAIQDSETAAPVDVIATARVGWRLDEHAVHHENGLREAVDHWKAPCLHVPPLRERRWWPWLLGLAICAVVGMTGSLVMFASWTEMDEADRAEAQRVFDEALAGSARGPAYVSIDAAGMVTVDRSLEKDDAREVETLVLLTWEPDEERLTRMRIPFWFVRIKSNDHVNLGTVCALLSKDWEHLEAIRDAQPSPELAFFIFLPVLSFESGSTLPASHLEAKLAADRQTLW